MVSSLSLCILTIIYLKITLFTIKQRRRTQTPYVSRLDEDKLLAAAVSSHSNFASYTPLFLIMILLLEINWETKWYFLLPFALLFCLGRYLHFLGLTDKEHLEKPDFNFRINSMKITIFTLLIGALTNGIYSLIYFYQKVLKL